MLCIRCIFSVHVSDRNCIVPGLYPKETPNAEPDIWQFLNIVDYNESRKNIWDHNDKEYMRS